jgi:hypothetical protein
MSAEPRQAVTMLIELTDRAARHARLRWLGVALFFVAAAVLLLDLSAIVTGRAPLRLLPWGLLGLGMSLGTFGANDDTTLHALTELSRTHQLPARYAREWGQEKAARPERLAGLHASTTAGVILPLVAAIAIFVAAGRGLTAWGLLP